MLRAMRHYRYGLHSCEVLLPCAGSFSWRRLSNALAAAPSLEHLHLELQSVDHALLWRIISFLPHLVSLRIAVRWSFSEEFADADIVGLVRCASLQSLHLEGAAFQQLAEHAALRDSLRLTRGFTLTLQAVGVDWNTAGINKTQLKKKKKKKTGYVLLGREKTGLALGMGRLITRFQLLFAHRAKRIHDY